MSDTNRRREEPIEATQKDADATARGIAEDIRATWEVMDKMTLMAQCLVCLLPIVAGVLAYGRLPDMMAIHWGFGNEPNGWAPREFVVFGVPIMMVVMQLVLVLSTEGALRMAQPNKGDVSSGGYEADEEADSQNNEPRDGQTQRAGRPIKAFAVVYWLIPVITVVLYAMTIAAALGEPVPAGKVTLGVLALVLIVSGNCIQQMPYSIARKVNRPVPKNERSYQRYARACSYGMMALGFACLIAMLLV